MKARVSNILLTAFVFQSFAAIADGATPDNTTQRLSLILVADGSPTSAENWQQLKLSACQVIDNLHQNDRVEILGARDGEPALHSDSVIQSPSISGRQNLRQCIRDIRQAFFLSKADVAKAVATAFEHLGRHSNEYRCAVLVVSTGNLSDDQVRQIRRLAAAYRFRNWSLAFLVPKGANRGLFVAASQGELDVMFLDKANLAQWLEKARDQSSAKTENTQEPQRLSPPQRTQPAEPRPPTTPIQPRLSPTPQVPVIPQPQPAPTPREPERSASPKESDNSVTRYILPVYPVPQDKLPLPTLPDAKRPSPSPDPPEKTKRQPWLRPLLKSRYLPAIAVGAGVLGLVVLVTFVVKLRRSGDGLPDLDGCGSAGTPQKLMCSVGDQQYDLGEEDSIDTLVVGKSPISAVPLPDDEELKDEHIKIIHRRRCWQIKNLAEQPVVVDGTAVNRGGKLDLLLPATIELTQRSRITLSRASLLAPEPEMQTTGESHEADDV